MTGAPPSHRIAYDNQMEEYSDMLGSLRQAGGNDIAIIDTAPDIMKKIHIACGSNCKIEIKSIKVLKAQLSIDISNGCSLFIEEENMFNGFVRLMMHETSILRIGRSCLWARSSVSTSDCHSILDMETGERLNHAQDIYIGDRVWVCEDSKILKGSKISSDTVIAMNSVVTAGKYPPNSVLAGIPARVVKSSIQWDVAIK